MLHNLVSWSKGFEAALDIYVMLLILSGNPIRNNRFDRVGLFWHDALCRISPEKASFRCNICAK
jgi:hypothetical protein